MPTSPKLEPCYEAAKLAAEAERSQKMVLESQEMQLAADLRSKQASLLLTKVNLGYTKISAPGDGTVGERQVRPGSWCSPGTQVISFVDRARRCRRITKKPSLRKVTHEQTIQT